MEKPKLKLIGKDGNAFFILARAQDSAKKAGWSKEQIDNFMQQARSGDYNNLLRACMDYFDCD